MVLLAVISKPSSSYPSWILRRCAPGSSRWPSTACGARGQPAVVTSTTHLHRTAAFNALPTVAWTERGAEAALRRAMHRHRVALVISEPWGRDMWHGLTPDQVSAVRRVLPEACFIVKADGARKRLLKAPGDHEPCWPHDSDQCVLVLSLAACGRPLDERTVHRLPRVTALSRDRTIGPGTLADVIVARNGYGERFPPAARRVLYLSACDSPRRLDAAREVAAAVSDRFEAIVAGDTPSGRFVRLASNGRAGV